jgi:type VII secretion-associated serine protease mycosin
VVVAVIDSGVDANHPDLKGSVLPGIDLLHPAVSPDGTLDSDGHGTQIAGVIAAHGQVEGIAPKAKILPIRAVPDVLTASSDIAGGVEWAIVHGASVINISAGGFSSADEQQAVDDAIAANIVVVAAAGNDSGGALEYPAAYPGVVAVTGTDRQGNIAAISSVGPGAVIAAPAVDIYSTTLHNGYSTASGTSDSAAIVAGVVALIRSKYPKLSARDVIHRLVTTADDRGPPGRDDQYGYGIVNPVKALTADVPLLTPTATPTTPNAAPVRGGNSTNWTPIVLIGVAALLIVLLITVAVAGRQRRTPAEP